MRAISLWQTWRKPLSMRLRNRNAIHSGRLARLCSIAVFTSAGSAIGASCDDALARGMVCEAANERALEIVRAGKLVATTVVQEVNTGSLVAFAASEPEKLDVTTAVLPLSTVKLMVAASWWDHKQPEEPELPGGPKMSVTEMIETGNDNAGRRMASALRQRIGTQAFLQDLEHYGFRAAPGATGPGKDESFWAEIPSRWKERLRPAMAYHSLGESTPPKGWEDTLSLGEERFVVTALHLSRFLQAAGNAGMMLPAVARTGDEKSADSPGPGSTIPARGKPVRVMSAAAALKLQVAMRAVVERGTAKSALPILLETGWSMGGKTGTGPGPESPGPNSDGWFAGLIFDPEGKPRFTVATFVKHGGLGGGNAARVSAELARFLSGAQPRTPATPTPNAQIK